MPSSTLHPSAMLISALTAVQRQFKPLEAQHPPLTPNSWTTKVPLVPILFCKLWIRSHCLPAAPFSSAMVNSPLHGLSLRSTTLQPEQLSLTQEDLQENQLLNKNPPLALTGCHAGAARPQHPRVLPACWKPPPAPLTRHTLPCRRKSFPMTLPWPSFQVGQKKLHFEQHPRDLCRSQTRAEVTRMLTHMRQDLLGSTYKPSPEQAWSNLPHSDTSTPALHTSFSASPKPPLQPQNM